MHLYELGQSSYETSHGIMLVHEAAFSRDEFEAMVLDVIPEVYRRERVKAILELIDMHVRRPKFTLRAPSVSLEHHLHDVAEALCERHGFRRPEIRAAFWGNGNEDMARTGNGEESDRIAEALRAAGITPSSPPD